MGVPGMESLQVWLSLPMCLLYMAALAGNVLLLGLVAADKALQAPMYQLLGLLAAAHLVLATSTVPKAQAVLWGMSGDISFGACLAQLFVAPVAFIAESSVLLAMAVDRYVAIRQPLRYRALLTQRVVGIVAVVAAVTRGDCVVAPRWPCSRDCPTVGGGCCRTLTGSTWAWLGWHVATAPQHLLRTGHHAALSSPGSRAHRCFLRPHPPGCLSPAIPWGPPQGPC